MSTSHSDFVHRKFPANQWEAVVKAYIGALQVEDNSLWYKAYRDLKKMREELVTLGYYVKCKYGPSSAVSFRLNKLEEAADGWIYKDDSTKKAVQIVTAYYERQEAHEDELIASGADLVRGDWMSERLKLLLKRIENRVEKKVSKQYQGLDVLLVGVNDRFVAQLSNAYADLRSQLSQRIEALMPGSNFRELAIVDADFVGDGQVLLFSNKAMQ